MRALYQAAFADRDIDAALRLVDPDMTQHNPRSATGRDGLRALFGEITSEYPGLRLEIKRLVAEGDHVAAHVHAVMTPGERGLAIVDLFRLEDGMIAEHWDVRQEVPAESKNANGMF